MSRSLRLLLTLAVVPAAGGVPVAGLPPAVAGQVLSNRPIGDSRITEASAAAISLRQPGLLWTMNDSGGDPVLFLLDSAGAARGAFSVPGARNRDWEALGAGRCGTRTCLYIGDTGDNGERRRSVTLYRVPEPEPASSPPGNGIVSTGEAEQLQVAYPDGSHDVEGLYVEPDGAVMLVSKGRSGGVHTYRVPAAAWSRRAIATATRIDSLPIPVSLRFGLLVTDAAISRDGKRVAVRTYTELWFFVRDNQGRLSLDSARPICTVPNNAERQGEGVGYWTGEVMALTSERAVGRRGGTITLLRCPGS